MWRVNRDVMTNIDTIMINDIKVKGGAMLWKYVDDTTISEIIPRGQLGGIQAVVDDLLSQWAL